MQGDWETSADDFRHHEVDQARIEPPAGCQAAPLRRRKRGMLRATVSPSSARRLLCQVPTPASQVREHARGR